MSSLTQEEPGRCDEVSVAGIPHLLYSQDRQTDHLGTSVLVLVNVWV